MPLKEKSFDGFNTPADAQRDFLYRVKYLKNAKKYQENGGSLSIKKEKNGKYYWTITYNTKKISGTMSKLKKGSAEAKAYMAKIRAKRGTTKKVGEVTKKEVYIEFMNSSKGFKTDRKYFNTYNDAVKFMDNNFEKRNIDMIKFVNTPTKKIGSTLLIEKNETQFTKPKKVYKINRDAKGRIKNYDKIEIQERSVNKKQKFFYKHEFTTEGKKEFKKYLIAETFFSNGILLYRAKGDRQFTEARSGLSFPIDFFNLIQFKKEMNKGENGAFGKRLKQAPELINSYIKLNGEAPL